MTTLPRVKIYLKKYSKAPWVYKQDLKLESRTSPVIDIIAFKEYEGIQLEFLSSDPEDLMLVEVPNGEPYKEFQVGDKKILTETRNDEDILVPGDYLVIVKTKKETYESLYRISPKNMDWDRLMNLRDYLEKKVMGLSHNLLKSQGGSLETEFEHAPHILMIYQHIKKNSPKLFRSIEDILKDPIKSVVQNYRQKNYSRKPDIKSQRWLSRKGSTKNANHIVPNFFFEKHTELTENNLENRWVKHILKVTKQNLNKIDSLYKLENTLKKENLYNKNKEIEGYENRIKKLNNSLGYDGTKKDLTKLINRGKEESKSILDNLLRIEKNSSEIAKITSKISRYEQETFLGKIDGFKSDRKVSVNIFKDSRYNTIYRFYKQIESINRKTSSAKQITFPYKRTSLLFEYYVLCLLIEVIQTNDFDWISGWLADNNDPSLGMNELMAGTLLKFENIERGFSIELAYDTQILPSNSENKSYFQANNNRTPDFRIAIYNKEGIFIDGLILDAKYRHHKYLWSDSEENDVMRQLNDYLRIWHYNSVSDKWNREAIQKVIAIYPKQDGVPSYFEKNSNMLSFLQIEPSDPDSDDEPFGYRKMEEIINRFLMKSTVSEMEER
ncbi:DUF2357 domain-containing protein [Paenibacillus kandeliae]|uniref:DUF2357 domain-containing protein n=1 Tax=Paenibacillus kandeliae TaxID=3231269 RepID=UPI0034598FF6